MIEGLDHYIDLTSLIHAPGLPEKVEAWDIRRSFVLINLLNEALFHRALEEGDLAIAMDALAAAMRVLADRVGVDIPPDVHPPDVGL